MSRRTDPAADNESQMWSAFRWVERLLRQLAAGDRPTAASPWLFWRRPPSPPRCPAGARPGGWPALQVLSHQFGLTDFECDVLLLCAAVELKPSLAELCAASQRPANRPFPTLDLAVRLFRDARPDCKPCWEVLSPVRPLLHWRLIELVPSASIAGDALKIDPRIFQFLIGLNGDCNGLNLHPFLQRFVVPVPPVAPPVSIVQEELAGEIAQAFFASGSCKPIAQLLGPNSEAKLLVMRGVASQLSERCQGPAFLYRLPFDALPFAWEDLLQFVSLWTRECMLYPHLLLLVEAQNLDVPDRWRQLEMLLARLGGAAAVAITSSQPRSIDGRISLIYDAAKPGLDEQKCRWASKGASRDIACRLAGRYNLNFPMIDRLSCETGDLQSTEGVEHVIEAARHLTRPRLDALAERIVGRGCWDDLVLPATEEKTLEEISAQIRNLCVVYDDWGVRDRLSRGQGLAVLFAGESGTGKTFAAEVLANDLQLDLYRIDLSAIIDKYIGETEKKLRQLFDSAEDGGCILFFDEADALFGKRSEIKDSHDRFANIQINYLLQRIESFRGLAILATNRRCALDPAFLRRLRFIVDFPFPSSCERLRIWHGLLPNTHRDPVFGRHIRLTDGDYDFLARVVALSGGHLRVIALNAAFLAADQDPHCQIITVEIVKRAARDEYRKLQRELPRELLDSVPQRDRVMA